MKSFNSYFSLSQRFLLKHKKMKVQLVLFILTFLASNVFCEMCHPLCKCWYLASTVNCGDPGKVKNISDATLQEIANSLDTSKVEAINFRGNNMETFNAQYFAQFKKLRDLSILKNSLTKLPDRVSDAIPSLKTLRVTENKLAGTLTKKEFAGYQNLTQLYLSRNQINAIEPGAFEDMKALKSLMLDNNKIKILKTGTFHGLAGMENIDLESKVYKQSRMVFLRIFKTLEILILDEIRSKHLILVCFQHTLISFSYQSTH